MQQIAVAVSEGIPTINRELNRKNDNNTRSVLLLFLIGVNQYIDISIRTSIRLSGDIRYIILTIRQYNVGFENSTFNRQARSSNSNMA